MNRRVIGFNAYGNGQEPDKQDEKNTDHGCVMCALDTWSRAFPPYRKDEGHGLMFLTSREIQESISDMVTTTISTITEYMMQHDYRMDFTDGGKVVWQVADLTDRPE